jgi:hypothetical protein
LRRERLNCKDLIVRYKEKPFQFDKERGKRTPGGIIEGIRIREKKKLIY